MNSPYLPDFSAMILDMDGLVLDTESGYSAAWREAAGVLGFELSEEFCRSMSGLPGQLLTQKLLRQCGVAFPLQDFRQLSDECWRRYIRQKGIPVQPGLERLLGVLRKYSIPYCLATNSHRTLACQCLEIAGIKHLFSRIISADQVPEPKPAADIFLAAARLLNRGIKTCLVIEDSYTGMTAAVSAGAFCVLIPSQPSVNSCDFEKAGLVLNDLHELAALVSIGLP